MNGDLWHPCRSCSLEPRRGLKDKSLPAHIAACPWSALTGKPAERRHCHCCLPLCRVTHTQAANTHAPHAEAKSCQQSVEWTHTTVTNTFCCIAVNICFALEILCTLPKFISLRALMQLPKYQLCLRCFLSPVNAAIFFTTVTSVIFAFLQQFIK